MKTPKNPNIHQVEVPSVTCQVGPFRKKTGLTFKKPQKTRNQKTQNPLKTTPKPVFCNPRITTALLPL